MTPETRWKERSVYIAVFAILVTVILAMSALKADISKDEFDEYKRISCDSVEELKDIVRENAIAISNNSRQINKIAGYIEAKKEK